MSRLKIALSEEGGVSDLFRFTSFASFFSFFSLTFSGSFEGFTFRLMIYNVAGISYALLN